MANLLNMSLCSGTSLVLLLDAKGRAKTDTSQEVKKR